MTEERRIVLDKINDLLNKRRAELLDESPLIHEVDDGVVVRFFTEWNDCEDNEKIKYKKIVNIDKPNESNVFFYLPKDSYFRLTQRFHIGSITCLSGKMEVNVNNDIRLIEGYNKMYFNSNDVEGKVLENTYIITTSDKSEWSSETREHAEINY